MCSNRLVIGMVVATICAGPSLSTGSGRAAALPPAAEEIVAVAEEVAGPVAERLGLDAFVSEIKSLFEVQATKLTPAASEVELADMKTEWMGFEPKTPLPGEVAPTRGVLPIIYRQAGQLLCGTALTLINDPDKASWQYLIEQVDNQILTLYPLGKNLVLYSELNDIYEKFRCGCYGAGTAELRAFLARMRYCEPEE